MYLYCYWYVNLSSRWLRETVKNYIHYIKHLIKQNCLTRDSSSILILPSPHWRNPFQSNTTRIQFASPFYMPLTLWKHNLQRLLLSVTLRWEGVGRGRGRAKCAHQFSTHSHGLPVSFNIHIMEWTSDMKFKICVSQPICK